jgi:hypothetical protein
MITQEKFCNYINYIQFLINLVDEEKNQKHIISIMKHLHSYFPRDKDGNSELENYCFYLNFGKLEDDYESPEELYNRLINNQNPNVV